MNKREPPKLKSLFQLIAGIATIGIFIFVITPYFTNTILKSQYKMIKEEGIDCNALFYTESEQAVEASGNYIKIILKEETITVREKLSSILELLPEHEFVQTHRSFIVSVKHIKRIQGNVIVLNSHRVPIGKLYKTKLSKLIG